MLFIDLLSITCRGRERVKGGVYRLVVGLSAVIIAVRVLLRVFDSKRLGASTTLVLVVICLLWCLVTFLPELIDIFAKWLLNLENRDSGTNEGDEKHGNVHRQNRLEHGDRDGSGADLGSTASGGSWKESAQKSR